MADPDLLESARAPVERGSAAAPARWLAHARRARWVVGAVAAAVLVAGLVSGSRPTAQHPSDRPLDSSGLARRGPSHPSVDLPAVVDGWVVVGRVDGFARQTRSGQVVWPSDGDVALLVQCPTTTGPLTVRVARRQPALDLVCVSGPVIVTADQWPPLVVAGGGPVTLSVTAGAPVAGAWVVAVLTRFRHPSLGPF